MAPPSLSSPFLTVVLTLLALGVMSGVQAKPVGHPVLNLDITSSIKIGRPYFGEKLGPFTVGQELTLTCSTEASESVSLSWWEGETEKKSSVKENDGIISSSFTIQTLRKEDNEREFLCRDEETLTTKTIELLILPVPVLDITSSIKMGQPIFGDTVGPFTAGQQLTLTCSSEDTLEIIKDGNHIEDGGVLDGIAGKGFIINCIVQGYNPSAVSWWEGDAELKSFSSESPYATNGVLSLKALTVDDSGRKFACRSLNGQLSKTVILDVNDAVEEEQPGYLIPLVVLLAISLMVTVTSVVMVICLRKKGFTSRVTSQSASMSNNAAGDIACYTVDQHDAKDAARLIEKV